MELLNPWAVYLSFLALPVILAYFLRHRAEPFPVSALFLWEGLEGRGRRAFRLTRYSPWLLLLQLLALTMVILALAEPVYYTSGTMGKVAIIIDGSASMTISHGGRSRYELAVERALEVVESAAGEVTILQAKRYPRLLFPLGRDKRRARAALRSSRPSLEGETHLEEVLNLLRGQAPPAQFQRIVYLTDHPPREGPEGLPPSLEVILVGQEARNLGLTALSLRPEPDPTEGSSLFLRLKNYTSAEERAGLTILADGREIFSQEVLLPPQRERAFSLPLPSLLPERVVAVLEVEDDFPWDDRRFFALSTFRERRVLWLGEEDRFLEGALRAAGPGGALITIISEPSTSTSGAEPEPDLIVANGTEIPPELELKGNILLVNSSYPPLIRLLGTEELSGPLEASNHPLLSGVEVENILVVKANRVALPEGGETILSSSNGLPLIYAKHGEDFRLCYIGFDLRWSNLPLTVDFPILIRNLLYWLLPPEPQPGEVGRPLPLDAAVIDPLGRSYRVGELERAPLPGFYTLSWPSPERRGYLAITLAPEEGEPVGAGEGEPGRGRGQEHREASEIGRPGRRPKPLWRYLSLGGLLILVLELLSYERAWGWLWYGRPGPASPRPYVRDRARDRRSK